MITRTILCVAVLMCLLQPGCATRDVNPAKPKSAIGYVDFYTDSCLDLSWRVKRARHDGKMVEAFFDYSPLKGNILRLEAPAGTNQFEVWFMNRFTTGPQLVQVQVEDAKITPVQVQLEVSGSGTVFSRSYEYRNTRRGVRQVAVTSTADQQTLEIDLTPAVPQDYRPKEQTSYFAARPK